MFMKIKSTNQTIDENAGYLMVVVVKICKFENSNTNITWKH